MSTTSDLGSGVHQHTRWRLRVSGIVQGVGFRPFVQQLAHELGLTGWVENTPQGMTIEIEGFPEILVHFQARLRSQAPGAANIHAVSHVMVPIRRDTAFLIRASHRHGSKCSVIPPDLATCADCLTEITDPGSRRYRYPFTTCTQCGPRYSIVESIPFDRDTTTMKKFPLCKECQAEYQDITDRRFHAEAITCPNCGPQVALWDSKGNVVAEKDIAISQAGALVRQGEVLAVKGLGGFQLWVDAHSEEAIQRIRTQKHRPRKPFAILFPSLPMLKEHCLVSPEEELLLTSPEAPIVLLRRKDTSTLLSLIAPDNPYIGAFLPYTPLHFLLTAAIQTPVVATSGNRSEEPIVTDEHEALIRLTGLADAFLVHGRPISRPVDDSVVRIVNGNVMMLRRARGYVPAPINLNVPGMEGKHRPSLLALGGHLKNTVAVTTPDHIIVSQHIGDLSTPEACAQFERTIADYLNLFDVKPQAIACDLHPDYRSTIHAYQLGRTMNLPVIPVQHHYAHILSCMAEHRLAAPVLGIAWDGAGYGTDGTLWGGEFLLADYSGFTRVGHLKPYRLPGGEICMREPRRVALSLLYETFGEACLEMDIPPIRSLGSHLAALLIELLKKDVNCPVTTSMGRLFDGISSILGLCHINTFEGEAALALEFAAERFFTPSRPEGYSLPFTTLYPQKRGKGKGFLPASMPFTVNWEPLIRSMVEETMDRHPSGKIGMKFHQALANMIVDARNMFSSHKIVLSGGVFQNSLLNQSIHANLREKDFVIHTHHYFPSHDGGIALGQATHSIFRTSLSSLAI